MLDFFSQNERQDTFVLEVGNLDISLEVASHFEAFTC
jgi:hypothetical protein